MHVMTTADQAFECPRQHRPSTLEDPGQSSYPKDCNSNSTRLTTWTPYLVGVGCRRQARLLGVGGEHRQRRSSNGGFSLAGVQTGLAQGCVQLHLFFPYSPYSSQSPKQTQSSLQKDHGKVSAKKQLATYAASNLPVLLLSIEDCCWQEVVVGSDMHV